MNVLITGGTGFIGSRLGLRCLTDGHSVRVLGQENTPAESYNKKLLEEKDQGSKLLSQGLNLLHLYSLENDGA